MFNVHLLLTNILNTLPGLTWVAFKTRDSEFMSPALVAQGVSARYTRHILEALLPQGELRE